MKKVLIIDLRKPNTSNDPIGPITKLLQESISDSQIAYTDCRHTLIRDCVGCWSCWWKTPGLCALKDEAGKVYSDYINSDHVVMLLDTANGFIDGHGKTFIDRLIQLYHPYILLKEGECIHRPRYDAYPDLHFYFETPLTNPTEQRVMEDYCHRVAYHSRCNPYLITKDTNDTFQHKSIPKRQPLEDQGPTPVPHNPTGSFAIYNGSPRGKKGNSLLMIDHIKEGLVQSGVTDISVFNLAETKKQDEWAQSFQNYTHHLFVFPLYVHAMPGIVMKFFEKLQPSTTGDCHVAFIVQSGFPESRQSHYLRPYLGLLAKRLGYVYDGLIIKGGVEGLQIKPPQSIKPFYNQLKTLGSTYGTTGIMDPNIKKAFEEPQQMSVAAKTIYTLLSYTGVTNFYWDMHLRKNGAFKQRFDRPYK